MLLGCHIIFSWTAVISVSLVCELVDAGMSMSNKISSMQRMRFLAYGIILSDWPYFKNNLT